MTIEELKALERDAGRDPWVDDGQFGAMYDELSAKLRNLAPEILALVEATCGETIKVKELFEARTAFNAKLAEL